MNSAIKVVLNSVPPIVTLRTPQGLHAKIRHIAALENQGLEPRTAVLGNG